MYIILLIKCKLINYSIANITIKLKLKITRIIFRYKNSTGLIAIAVPLIIRDKLRWCAICQCNKLSLRNKGVFFLTSKILSQSQSLDIPKLEQGFIF